MGFESVHIVARFDGQTFVPEMPVEVPEGTLLSGWTQPEANVEAWVPPDPGEPRKPGSAKGRIWMNDDFDDPLEDFAEYM